MSQIALLLDKAKKYASPPNSSGLALRLGVSRQAISGWRNGADPVSDDRIAQLAKMAHEDPGYWLAAMRAERATGVARTAWLDAAKRLASAAAVILFLGVAPTPARAEMLYTADLNAGGCIHYAKLLARVRARIRTLLTFSFTRWTHGPAPTLLA